MGARRSNAILRSTLILSAVLALASCSTLPKLHHDPIPVKVATAPSEAREITLADPAVAAPMAEELQAPQIASNVPSRPTGRKPLPLVKQAPSKDAAPEPDAVVPSELMGFDFPAVLHVLRKPDAVQNSALSIVWTYSQSDCMLQLFFYPDIQTKIFHLLKYDLKDGTGEKPSDSSSCMRHIARTDESPLP
ncbi:MAG TPA: hypothetical protein VNH44_11945 [Micropepsaceae bacterium]|nr:hypothetical protein [Micropepsaceae bacterium]